MALINGGKGIGTGFAYEGLCHDPLAVIKYVKNKLNKRMTLIKMWLLSHIMKDLKNICKEDVKDATRYIFKGKYEIIITIQWL